MKRADFNEAERLLNEAFQLLAVRECDHYECGSTKAHGWPKLCQRCSLLDRISKHHHKIGWEAKP